jgi:peptidyl-prolyl cis-trans isomerase D
MFDLFRSREKTVRYLLGGLLVLVALSMVITMVPGFGSGAGPQRDNQTIAEIGGEKVTATEVAATIQREVRQSRMTKEMAEFYVPLFVQQMIAERATAFQAKRMGFEVGDAELAVAIRSLVPSLYDNGKFVGREAYEAYLRQVNMSIPQFEDNVRNQILMTRLEGLALEGIVVPPAQVEEQYKLKFEKFKIAYFGIKEEMAVAAVKVTPEEVKNFWEGAKARYTRPLSRSWLMYVLDETKAAALAKVDEAALRAAYQAQIQRFKTEERVKVRHILLKTQDKPKEEVEKQRKKTDALLAQLKGGADFADLAKKNSEDPGSAANGGDLSFVVRGQTVAEFERTAFALKPGELSNVISTMYGFHILKVEGREDAKVKPFEEARAELAAEMSREGITELMRKAAGEIRAALARSVADADRVAQSYGIAAVKVERAEQSDPVPEIGTNAEFGKAVFALPLNGISGVQELNDGKKLVVAKVLAEFPPRPAEFKEAEGAARQQLIATKASTWTTAQLKLASDKLNSGADFAAAAKAVGAELKNPPEFGRDSPIEGLGMASQFNALFSKKPGEHVGPMDGQGGVFFLRLIEKIPADMAKFAAERDQFQVNLKGRKARERKEIFNDGLVQQLVKEGKIKIYDNAIKMLAQTFRN